MWLSSSSVVLLMVVLIGQGRWAGLKVRFRPQPLDLPLARKLIAIGTPAALDIIVFNVGFLSIIGMLGRLDEIAVAAHGIGLRVQALAFVPGMSIGQATGALVGNALGAGKPDAARAVARAVPCRPDPSRAVPSRPVPPRVLDRVRFERARGTAPRCAPR